MPLGTGTTQSKNRAKSPTVGKAAGKQDAIKLLTADHDEVDGLFEQYEDAKDDSDKKAELAEKICKMLTVHAAIEEEIFYPAARDALAEEGQDMMDEAEVEHATAKWLISQIEDGDPEDELFDAKVKVLSEYIKHHVKEEEGEMFPKVKKTKIDLEALGVELLDRKNQLMGDDDEMEEDEEDLE